MKPLIYLCLLSPLSAFCQYNNSAMDAGPAYNKAMREAAAFEREVNNSLSNGRNARQPVQPVNPYYRPGQLSPEDVQQIINNRMPPTPVGQSPYSYQGGLNYSNPVGNQNVRPNPQDIKPKITQLPAQPPKPRQDIPLELQLDINKANNLKAIIAKKKQNHYPTDMEEAALAEIKEEYLKDKEKYEKEALKEKEKTKEVSKN